MTLNVQRNNFKWYPVCTRPKAEKQAFAALIKKGFETYLPLYRQLRQWSDRKRWVEEPFITSYLFVRVREQDFGEVLMTRGVARFVYFSGKVASMPDQQIKELKLVMASPYELELTADDLQPGEKIIIKGGLLKGMRGEVISYRSQKQLILRIENLGYSVIVHVAPSMIDRF